MPSKSAAQARLMAACSHGAGYESCPPAKVSAEFNAADKGTGILSKRADGGELAKLLAVPEDDLPLPANRRTIDGYQVEYGKPEGGEPKPRRPGWDHRSNFAPGGGIPSTPWFVRREAAQIYHPSGFLHDSGGGRSDTLPRTVAAESHVIPADVVAGLGEGNSLAGAKVLDMMMKSGPFGMAVRHRAAGGGVGEPEKVPVALSGGEYTLSPEQVSAWGGGSLRKGHSAIDKFILSVRKHTASKLRTLPPPKR